MTDRKESPEERAAKLRARREAKNAVRLQATGKDRSQLRELFVAELARRGLHESPSSIEFGLDQIQDSSPLAKANTAVSVIGVLGGMARVLHRAFRDEELLSVPDWLKPPMRASIRVEPLLPADKIAVILDPNAGPWLDLVLKAAPTRMGFMATVDAWLAWDPEPQSAESRLAVYIGKERIGVIENENVASFQSVMARSYDLPVLTATLIKRSNAPRYIVELPVPPMSPEWFGSGGDT
jgi:hypothetical protein